MTDPISQVAPTREELIKRVEELEREVRFLKHGDALAVVAAEAKVKRLEARLRAVRAFAEDMRDWCSPHGVAVGYADRLLAVLDRVDHPAESVATCRPAHGGTDASLQAVVGSDTHPRGLPGS